MADNPLRRKTLIDPAQKKLNWKPIIMFDEGLEITRKYFQKK